MNCAFVVTPLSNGFYRHKCPDERCRKVVVIKSQRLNAHCKASDPPKPTAGPGTELAKLIGYFGFNAAAGCHCKEHAAEMDSRGCEWCRDNMGTILDWLAEAAEKAQVCFFRTGAMALVELAIYNAEQQAKENSNVN